MSVFLVIPTYNEKDNLPLLVRKVFSVLPEAKMLIVDDASPDGTGVLAENLRQHYPERLFVLHRAGKQGLGSAYVMGFRQALRLGATKVIQMDADFSHPIERLPKMLALAEDYDLVIGSRYVEGGQTPGLKGLRRLISWGGGVYTRAILGLKVRDVTSGFKCFDASVLADIDLDNFKMSGYGFQIELIYKTFLRNYRVVEMPICFKSRRQGESKMGFKIVLEALLNVLVLRRDSFAFRRAYSAQLDY
ncbi:MAG: polyprenol monophosphomannose synthase [Deltaproteobacteria bacterium]|nr:polyprenol monophosphomannose synthase [Deltaproteobacteria bacterium]